MVKRILLWSRWGVFALGVAWLLKELLRVVIYVGGAWGALAVFREGVVWHKLGEALVAVPYILSAIWIGVWSGERSLVLLRRWRWAMWAGGVLNGLAWLDLRNRVGWSWWCLALLALGLLGPWLLQVLVRREKGRVSRAAGGLFVFLCVVGYLSSNLTTGHYFVPLPAAPPSPVVTRDERWRQDLHYLASELVRLHVDAFHTVTPEEFERSVSELDQAIPTLQEHEIVVGLMRIVASIGDSHTMLPWWETDFHRYPIRAQWFGNSFYVAYATEPYQQTLGTRVVQIGPFNVDEVYAAVSTLVAHENDVWPRVFSERHMVTPEVLHALKILPDMESGNFVFEDARGNTFAVELQPISSREQVEWIPAVTETALYQQNWQEPFWFEYLEDSQTVFFKYNRCVDFWPFLRFSFGLLSFIDEHPVERLVIDMRDNSGGNSNQFEPFLWGLKRQEDVNQPGRLFVIVGPKTYSSAIPNTIDLQQQTHAILIGEPTGGKPNAYGDVRTFYLPNSSLAINYSSQYFTPLDVEVSSLEPDILVPLSIDDYLAGRDPVLDAILAYGKE